MGKQEDNTQRGKSQCTYQSGSGGGHGRHNLAELHDGARVRAEQSGQRHRRTLRTREWKGEGNGKVGTKQTKTDA